LVTIKCVSFFLTAPWDRTTNIVDYSPNQTDATIIEINPSTYNLRMFAKNNLGISKASNVLTITTKAGVAFVVLCPGFMLPLLKLKGSVY